MIHSLTKNQIIIVGTNSSGQHISGAANQAFHDFGLKAGVGEGLSGQTYAFPTLNDKLKQRTHRELLESVTALYQCCIDNSDKEFLMTPVGTGIAGFSHEYMKSLFQYPPENLKLPDEWK